MSFVNQGVISHPNKYCSIRLHEALSYDKDEAPTKLF
jgi:hypothetical protein